MNDQGKAQWIRLADVFLIGPLMIWGGKRLYDRGDDVLGLGLGTLGVLTIVYNGRNYLEARRA